jgi:hypothetical protein
MTEVRELIDAELDGVCGGFLDLTSVTDVTKTLANVQTITQNGAAIGGSAVAGVAAVAGAANLAQVASQNATNVIG